MSMAIERMEQLAFFLDIHIWKIRIVGTDKVKLSSKWTGSHINMLEK